MVTLADIRKMSGPDLAAMLVYWTEIKADNERLKEVVRMLTERISNLEAEKFK